MNVNELEEYAVKVEHWDLLKRRHVVKWHYFRCKSRADVYFQIERILGAVFDILEIEQV